MSKLNEIRKEINQRSGNNFSRSEFTTACYIAKIRGYSKDDSGQIEKALNDDRNSLSNQSERLQPIGVYTGYAHTESDY